jgi:peptide/nickel transport system substrate-binding protein
MFMKMKLAVLFILLAVIMSACAPAATPVPATTAPTAAAKPTDAPKPTTAPATAAPTAAPAATKAPEATQAPAAASGGTLIGAWDVGPAGGPQQRPYDNTAGGVWLMKIWSPLESYNISLTGLEPQLATKWTPNADATKWTFTLRPNVKWHDGDAFTADDVKFTFELALNPKFGWRNSPGLETILVGAQDYIKGNAKEITGLKVVDPLTIELSLSAADPKLPFKLAGAMILPKHVLAKEDPEKLAKSDWFLTSPVGTGPWKISKYVKDQYQDLVPNENYWAGKPKIAHLINRYFADETAAAIALEKGEIQFSYVAGDVAAKLKTNSAFKVLDAKTTTANYFMFNLRDKRMQDVRVRQAFWYAIDRKSIIQQVFGGAASALPCTITDSTFWPKDINQYDYNPTKAKQLLKDANWNSGDTLEMWTYYATQQQKDAMQAMQAFLAEVGIKVTFKIMDTPAYNAQFYTGEGWAVSYRGGGITFGTSPRPYMMNSPQTNDKKSWAGFDDPKLNAMIQAAETAVSDADYVKNLQDYCKYENENALNASMWVAVRYGGYTAKLKNFAYLPAAQSTEDHSELWELAP